MKPTKEPAPGKDDIKYAPTGMTTAGLITCEVCSGEGQVPDVGCEPHTKECRACNGSGVIHVSS